MKKGAQSYAELADVAEPRFSGEVDEEAARTAGSTASVPQIVVEETSLPHAPFAPESSDGDDGAYCIYCAEPEGTKGFIEQSPCHCSGGMMAIHRDCLRADLERNFRIACSVCKFTYRYARDTKYHSVWWRLAKSLGLFQTRLVISLCLAGVLALQTLKGATAGTGTDMGARIVATYVDLTSQFVVLFALFFVCIKLGVQPYCTVRVRLLVPSTGDLEEDAILRAGNGAEGKLPCIVDGLAPPAKTVTAFSYDVTPDMRTKRQYPRALVVFDSALRGNGPDADAVDEPEPWGDGGSASIALVSMGRSAAARSDALDGVDGEEPRPHLPQPAVTSSTRLAATPLAADAEGERAGRAAVPGGIGHGAHGRGG